MANRFESLVGNLPSHISIFGSDGGQGGRALSAGADDDGSGQADETRGVEADQICYAKEGIQLPSHISIFGSSSENVLACEHPENVQGTLGDQWGRVPCT
jgi:hypothetical protein